MAKNRKIQVKQTEITIIFKDNIDFISLTDMTMNFKEGSGLIGKWITNKNTLEYLGTWEKINNPKFNYPEFGVIENADKDIVQKLSDSVSHWVKSQAMPVAVNQIQNMFTGDITPKKISPEQKKLEDKFKPENFDLINWFVISNK